jgi:ribosome-associated protein
MVSPSMPEAGVLRLAPGAWVPRAALVFTAVRASGPGGQNVNNTSSKVELRLRRDEICGLSWRAGERLITLAGHRLTADGELVLSCDETRSLRTNTALVVERLCALVVDAQAVPRPRRPTRPGRGAVERRLAAKARIGARKRHRGAVADDD